MGIELRLLLIAGAAGTLFYFLYQIRKSRLQIDFAIFWSLFAGMLLFLGLFPQIPIWLSHQLQIESPANMVFLGVIFILMLKLFTNTIKLSKMNRQIVRMAQHLALLEKESEEGQMKACENTFQEKKHQEDST